MLTVVLMFDFNHSSKKIFFRKIQCIYHFRWAFICGLVLVWLNNTFKCQRWSLSNYSAHVHDYIYCMYMCQI